MQSIQRGGRTVEGFGVGAHLPQSTFVRPGDAPVAVTVTPTVASKLHAFVGGAVASGVAGVAATALFGEGGGPVQRLQRGWRLLSATAALGGVVGMIAR
jgi:hypothetical protein